MLNWLVAVLFAGGLTTVLSRADEQPRPAAAKPDDKSKQPSPSVRPWYRLHATTWLLLAVLLVGLLFLIAPGEHKATVDFLVPKEGTWSNYEHGWPMAFLIRWIPNRRQPSAKELFGRPLWLNAWAWDWSSHGEPAATRNPQSLYKPSGFSATALAIDLTLAVAILAISAGTFEFWRRSRRRPWQLHLTDIATLILLVAAALGWWKVHQVRSVRELQAMTDLQNLESNRQQHYFHNYHYAGPEWLAKLIGRDHCPKEFTHFIDVTLTQGRTADLRRVVPLLELMPYASGLTVEDATNADVQELLALSHLERLGLKSDSAHPVTDEALPTISHFPKLRALGLYHCRVSDVGLVHLQSMKQLRLLNIFDSAATPEGIEQLRQSLPGCRIITDRMPAVP